jgi:hypothetical protein
MAAEETDIVVSRINVLDAINAALDWCDTPSAQCYCGTELTFTPQSDGIGSICYCRRCERRSQREGDVVFVYGYGRTSEAALANWNHAMEAM